MDLYRKLIDPENSWERKFYNLDPNYKISKSKAHISEASNKSEKGELFSSDLHTYSEKPIIFMLIRSGYIDQSYINYLSLSQGSAEELTAFRRALADNQDYSSVFDIELGDEALELFLKEDEDVFKEYATRESILNFSLISYLLRKKGQKNSEYLKFVLDFYFNRRDGFNLSFIKDFISKSLISEHHDSIKNIILLDNAKLFIKSIFKQNVEALDSFLSVIQPEELVDISEDLKNILLLILVVVKDDLSNLSSPNVERLKSLLRSIKGYVNQFTDVIEDKEESFICGWFEQLDMKVELSQPSNPTDEVAKQLFQDFISISAYEITKQNIIEIFKFFKKPEDKLSKQNYTAIIENFTSDNNFREYIKYNIYQYVNDILIEQELGIKESNEAMIELINNKLLSNDQRMRLIKQHQDLCFKADFEKIEFENIPDDKENDIGFCQLLFTYDLERRKEDKAPVINATWDNIYWGICSNNTLTQKLQNEWLMIACNEIIKSDLPTDEERLNSLKELIAFNNDLNFEIYSVLMKSLNVTLADGGDLEKISQLSWDKVEFLMKESLIVVSAESVKMIYDNYIKESDDE